MPRTLPWLKPGATTSKPKPAPSRPRKPPPTTSTSTAPTTAISTSLPRPSPPNPADDPPIEYMRPTDDLWVMVEDELLSTASLYTRAIHLDEYQRLQAAAARHIPRITRPAASPTTPLPPRRRGRKRSLGEAQAAELWTDREEGMRGLVDDEDDEGHLATGGRELRGLMRRDTTGGSQSLGRWMKQKRVATRAAAGLTRSEVKEGGARARHAEMLRERSPGEGGRGREAPDVRAGERGGGDTDGGTSDDDLGAVSVRRRMSAAPAGTKPEERRPVRLKSVSNRTAGLSADPALDGAAAGVGGKERKDRRTEKATKLIDDGFDFFETFAVPVVKTRFRGRAPATGN